VASSRHANALMGTRPFCNGPDDVKSPDGCRAAGLMFLSVVNVLPPHHAVSPRSGMMASRQFHCETAVWLPLSARLTACIHHYRSHCLAPAQAG
jgi:hypothetical protein